MIQYQDSDTGTRTFAIAYIENAPVTSGSQISNWEVTDIATTDFVSELNASQFSFVVD